MATGVPGVSTVPGAGLWLNTICGGNVAATSCTTDVATPSDVAALVVVVAGRVVVVVGGRVVVGGCVVVVGPTELHAHVRPAKARRCTADPKV